MVLIIDGNSEQFAHVWRKYAFTKKFIFVNALDLNKFTQHERTYFWITIYFKYHGVHPIRNVWKYTET